MQTLLVDFITSLDGFGAAEGWPGWWGLQSPEYLAFLDQPAEKGRVILMGANTYKLMSGMAETAAKRTGEMTSEEAESFTVLTAQRKVVFSKSLKAPLTWANAELVSGDAAEAVRKLKETSDKPLTTLGSVSLCRSLLKAGLVDRFRVVIFPVITGKTGQDRIYDGYPDVALDLVSSRTFEGGLQLVEYAPRVLKGPPGAGE